MNRAVRARRNEQARLLFSVGGEEKGEMKRQENPWIRHVQAYARDFKRIKQIHASEHSIDYKYAD
tara:strand:+ start:553 stop:747 length:195 start_codon:yes stop_codon:yes gene_type:complete